MRVLVAIAVHQLYSATVARALMLDWPHAYDTVLLRGDDMAQASHQRIAAKYERARHLALAGGYDAMLSVEADMLIPAHALTALAEVGSDITYGLYCWRHEHLNRALNVYLAAGAEHGVPLQAYPETARERWGRAMDCAGVGMGCTLIRRRVLERQPFRHVPSKLGLHCDWWYAIDAQTNGFTQAAHLGVACGHILDRERAVWPDAAAPALHRIATYEGA